MVKTKTQLLERWKLENVFTELEHRQIFSTKSQTVNNLTFAGHMLLPHGTPSSLSSMYFFNNPLKKYFKLILKLFLDFCPQAKFDNS